MRVASSRLLFAFLVLTACSADDPSSESAGEPQLLPPTAGATPGGGGTTQGGTTPAPGGDPQADADLAEVVYVLIDRWDGGTGYCTGALVSKDIVLTAAHCLDWSMAESFTVVAPLAPGKPKVTASNRKPYDADFDDPSEPDIGILHLDEPIDLPAYAEMTDVSPKLDAGETVTGVAVVRATQQPEADPKLSQHFPVSSTVQFGYQHGIATPLFSQGGDSGAGLFLVEKGKRTHKLIGIARQPEPARNLDHFTRLDKTIAEWFAENGEAD